MLLDSLRDPTAVMAVIDCLLELALCLCQDTGSQTMSLNHTASVCQ